jgi:hypothetical protein
MPMLKVPLAWAIVEARGVVLRKASMMESSEALQPAWMRYS